MAVQEALQLSDKQKRFVAQEIKSGRYRTENEVLLAGLELMARKQRVERKRQAIRELIQPAIDELDAGKGVTLRTYAEIDDYFKDLRQRAHEILAKE